MWSAINPLSQMGLLYFIMTYVFKSNMPNILLWLISGLAIWIVIQNTISRSCMSLVSRRALMQNNNISPSLLVAADMLSEVFILAPFFVIGIVVSFAYNTQSWSLLLIPIILVTLMGFLFGVGLVLATLTPLLRDLPYLVGLGLQVAFWLTPIAYSKSAMGNSVRIIVQMNPFTYFIEWSQAIFLGQTLTLSIVFIPIIIALVSVGIGMWTTKKLGKIMVIHL